MTRRLFQTFLASVVVLGFAGGLAAGNADEAARPKIITLNPPEKGFFTKELLCDGVPIKASAEVTNAALYVAYDRMSRQLRHLPMVASNLVASGVEVHIIGRHQVTSDLPEFRRLKGKALPEYNGLTIDQRTRGMGGRLTSCGEENLLQLPGDHYAGRDILTHEFAHAIRQYGIPLDLVERFNQQRLRSLTNGLWRGSYAGSNGDEFFAELGMWYFGTHGDLHMTGPKPANGPEGLKQYDPEAYQLIDEFYRGQIPIPPMHEGHPWTGNSSTTNRVSQRSETDD